ncbi:hypothetical protein HAX54_014157 [Datura stramonium]|uniref:Glyoxal oxidase N-terminal domain-containing protein n=1 Tax=Datura stramonium TaxID=4076 RepID=A0ABS8TQG5_DATST|nr:hypothetical protein [Datura stramonium]
METLPLARTIGDTVILTNGNFLIVNGAASGIVRWQIARNPVLSPVIYRPIAYLILDSSYKPRMSYPECTTKQRFYSEMVMFSLVVAIQMSFTTSPEFFSQ